MKKSTIRHLVSLVAFLLAAYAGAQGLGWQLPTLGTTAATAPAESATVVPTPPADATLPTDLSDPVPVVKVVDGDTIDVSLDGKTQRVRFLGMNTPETVDPRKPVQCFGKEASDEAKSVLTGTTVRLEADKSQGDVDKYGRLLRYIFLPDGTNFNLFLVQQGFAYEYTYDWPYEYQATFKAAQADAETNKRGLWADNTCAGQL